MSSDGGTMFPKITEQGLEDLRKRIGVAITDTVEPWNYEATRDAIRHYAHGIGDDSRRREPRVGDHQRHARREVADQMVVPQSIGIDRLAADVHTSCISRHGWG